MYPKKFPAKLPKWNADGQVKCVVCEKSSAYIRNYTMCLWCYRQMNSGETWQEKWVKKEAAWSG
jgi:ribosomal protein S14